MLWHSGLSAFAVPARVAFLAAFLAHQGGLSALGAQVSDVS
jgi:hypothetical protein